MSRIGSIFIDLKMNTASIAKGIDRINRKLGNFSRAVNRMMGVVKAAFAVAFGAVTLGNLGKMADRFAVLQARIKVATEATRDYNKVSRELLKTAKETGGELDTNVQLFQRISIGARELGKSNDDVLRLVKAVQQLGVVSGASSTAMRAGLLQFGQAMSSNIVRAEEYNSLQENLFQLVQEIAKGMGVTTGQLRKMVVEGKLLSKDVFEALVGRTEKIEEMFKKMPLSMERAFNKLKLTFSEVLGETDQTVQLTTKIAKLIDRIADRLGSMKGTIRGIAAGAEQFRITGLIGLTKDEISTARSRERIARFTGQKASAARERFEIAKGEIRLLELQKELLALQRRASGGQQQAIGGAAIGAPVPIAEALELKKSQRLRFPKFRIKDRGIGEAIEAFDTINERFNKMKSIVESLKTPLEKHNEEIRELTSLYREGFFTTGDFELNLARLRHQYKETQKDASKDLEEIQNVIRRFGQTFEDTFIDSFREGKFAFKDMVASMLEDLARLILRVSVLEPIGKKVAKSLSGGLLSNFGSKLLGTITGGVGPTGPLPKFKGFAAGGPIAANTPAIVGERGPELFMPRTSGNIVPNHQMGGVTLVQNITLQTIDSRSFEDRLAEHAKTIGNIGVDAVNRTQNRRGRVGILDSARG